jgi:hypothetical protein
VAPLFPFQRQNVAWAVRRGRAALFLDTGLGKTIQQLEWALQVAEHTGRQVLILAPLAVAQQTAREAGALRDPGGLRPYARGRRIGAHRDHQLRAPRQVRRAGLRRRGARRVRDPQELLGLPRTRSSQAFKRTPYKLACTATPAPNDHLELGNHAEFLGVMTRTR